jgi:hypothetical protein
LEELVTPVCGHCVRNTHKTSDDIAIAFNLKTRKEDEQKKREKKNNKRKTTKRKEKNGKMGRWE